MTSFSFTTIRNYTTLKPIGFKIIASVCFTTIRNYTTLKPHDREAVPPGGFTTIRNYTTLKLDTAISGTTPGFTTIRNYTTLKRKDEGIYKRKCFTTIRNYTTLKPCTEDAGSRSQLHYHTKLHYSQTSNLKFATIKYSCHYNIAIPYDTLLSHTALNFASIFIYNHNI